MDGDWTLQGGLGARHRRLRVEWWALPGLRHHLPEDPPSMFLVLMVGAPRPPALPYIGPTVGIFGVDGGRSRTSDTAIEGACRRCFLC
jgi:hypothetical protein